MVQKYIDKIIMSSDNNKMKELEDVLLKTIRYVKDTDIDTYKQIEDDLYEIVEGRTLNKEMAMEWVSKMKPKAKWSIDEIEQIKNKYKTDMPLVSLYAIMNMLYSDLGDVLGEEMTEETIQKYVLAAEDWYYDEDASKTEDEKLYCYVKCIVL